MVTGTSAAVSKGSLNSQGLLVMALLVIRIV
jgi:hypothetical protein